MKDEYRSELLALLGRRPGKGMALGVIVRQLYNSQVSLFASSLDFEHLYNQVGRYLRYHSKKKNSPFVHCKKRGYYTVRRQQQADYPRFL